MGDLGSIITTRLLWEYDALTFPGATLGFAWAGQLSILRNTPEHRSLFTLVPSYLELGLKTGTGEARQSGWEERVFLREVLKSRPSMRILLHMAAQFDYKAQWYAKHTSHRSIPLATRPQNPLCLALLHCANRPHHTPPLPSRCRAG